MRDLDVPDLQLVQQQADPLQEEHSEGAGRGECLRRQSGVQSSKAGRHAQPGAILGRRLWWRLLARWPSDVQVSILESVFCLLHSLVPVLHSAF